MIGYQLSVFIDLAVALFATSFNSLPFSRLVSVGFAFEIILA
jgi:hypothetical protein